MVNKYGWTSVKTEMPPLGKMVMLYTTYEVKRATVGYLYKPEYPQNCLPYFIFFAWNLARAGYHDYGCFICPGNEYVTHWRYLPDAPKGAEQNEA